MLPIRMSGNSSKKRALEDLTKVEDKVVLVIRFSIGIITYPYYLDDSMEGYFRGLTLISMPNFYCPVYICSQPAATAGKRNSLSLSPSHSGTHAQDYTQHLPAGCSSTNICMPQPFKR